MEIEFILQLNVEEWGKYKKGDKDRFLISVFDEANGLVRFPIDKRWSIISYEIID